MFGKIILRYLLRKPYSKEIVEEHYSKLQSKNLEHVRDLIFEILDAIEDDHVDENEIMGIRKKVYDLLLNLDLDVVVREEKKENE